MKLTSIVKIVLVCDTIDALTIIVKTVKREFMIYIK